MFHVPGTQPLTEEDWTHRLYEALDIFSPGAPIDEASLFAGRSTQIDRMVETVLQRGQHAILYGERGVGKSSLANTFSSRLLGSARLFHGIHINCHPTDNFTQIWGKVFRRLERDKVELTRVYHDEILPDDVIIELSNLPPNRSPIIILDEFDKLPSQDLRNQVSNTIKNLSDRSVRATIIVVGVADSVSRLIDEHQSLTRCLRQIPMQRMLPAELREIILRRLPRIAMTIEEDALAHIVALSRGLPHYAHLIGQQSAKTALEERSLIIKLSQVESSMAACIGQTAQTVREQYHQATISPRKGNIYKEVILASALSHVDELGYFAPADIRGHLSDLLEGRDCPVSLFGQHLKALCEPDRGTLLEKTGTQRKFRYRFTEPMMQPFILMDARRRGVISREQVYRLASSHYASHLS